ncbi:MAG: MBL fold metallo-hydrolase [Calditrichota bacterium]
MKILSRVSGSHYVNMCLVWCERTGKAAIFDAPDQAIQIADEIGRRGLQPEFLINTHGHLDHIEENAHLKELFNVPLLIHEKDRPMLIDPAKNLSLYTGENIVSPDADRTIGEGDVLKVGDGEMKIFHIPGHTPGSLVFYYPGFLIAGDTLFAGGIGRTDFPGGDERALLENITEKILTLPEDTIVYPGHGPATTVGEERRTNPFLRT